MKLTIFVLISSEGIGLNLPRSLHKFFILDLHEYLGYGGVERRRPHIVLTRRSARTSFINLPPSISLGALNF